MSYTLSQEDIGRKKITIVWKSNEQAETVRNSFTRRIPQTGRLSTGESITGLTASAMSRAVADWMVGMNLSQLFTLRNKAIAQYSEKNGTVSLLTKDDKFSIGRVMTPTLKFIYLRDKAINEFISKEFYQIASNYEAGFTGMRFVGNVSENRFWDKAAAQSIMQKLDGQKVGKVEDVAAKVNSKNAPIGFHSSGFNGLMAKKLAIPVTESAAIIDAIYNDDLLSYPRVDSKHMTEEEFKELRNSFIRLMTNVDFIKGLPKEICDGMIEANDGNFTPKIPIADDSKIIEAHGCLHPVLPAGREKDILAMLNGKDKRAVAYTEIFKNSL